MKMNSFKRRDFRQVRQSGRAPLRPASLRGERSNVPRIARYFTERGELLCSAYGMLTLEHRYAYE